MHALTRALWVVSLTVAAKARGIVTTTNATGIQGLVRVGNPIAARAGLTTGGIGFLQ